MKTRRVLWSGCLALLLLPAQVGAGTDSGRARFVPWSGSWWPVRKGKMLGPLRKYDALTGLHAAGWEARNKNPARADAWFGYCHAWSAAAVMEREPRLPLTLRGRFGQRIHLSVGDQKGLLTICHYSDATNSFGQRYEGKPGDDFQDIYPDRLWKQLRFHLKQRGVPLVIDADPGIQVWNYPVYSYRITHRPHGSDGKRLGCMELLMADDSVGPDFLGTKVKRQTYLFTFRMRQGTVILGSGQWYGASRKWHPDFAWYPTGVKPQNPYIRYATVKRMLHGERTRDMEESAGTIPAEVASLDSGKTIAVSSTELAAVLASRKSSFTVELSLSGGRTLAAGKAYSIKGKSARDGYLYLFHLAPRGKVKLLYPMPGQDNRLTAGKGFEIGGGKDKDKIRFLAPKSGVHRIKAIVTRTPLGLGRLVAADEATAENVGQGRGFHWAPTEAELVEELLRGLQEKKLTPADIEEQTGCSPTTLLGPFGQKELAFHVEPAKKD